MILLQNTDSVRKKVLLHLFKFSSFASMAAVVPLTVLSSIRYCSRSYSHGLACSVLGFSAFILLMASTALQTRFTKK